MFQIRFNLPLRGLEFNPRPVLVGFVADKVALVQVFLPVLLFSLLLLITVTVTITSRLLLLHVAFTRTNGLRLGTF